MLHIPAVLSPAELAQIQAMFASTGDVAWGDGRVTAGSQAAVAKNNRQLPEDGELAQRLRSIVLPALSRSAVFFSAALPKRIYPPLFNRYGGAHNSFGNHVDNAIRTHPASAQHLRSDLSFTLFLNEPDAYEGGELVIEDGMGGRAIKLPAGDLILYSTYSVHRVEPVTAGTRLACFSWVESMLRDPQQRQLLHDLDMSILSLRQESGETPAAIQLTNCYHNLLRIWATV